MDIYEKPDFKIRLPLHHSISILFTRDIALGCKAKNKVKACTKIIISSF